MRRLALVPMLMVLAASTGCVPAPLPLPPGEVRPHIDDVTVAPSPVTAGSLLTVSVTASDDGPSSALTFEMERGFDGPWVDGWWAPDWLPLSAEESQCSSVVVELVDGHRATATISCTLPVDIPRGEWRTSVTVRDGVVNSFWSEVVRFRVA